MAWVVAASFRRCSAISRLSSALAARSRRAPRTASAARRTARWSSPRRIGLVRKSNPPTRSARTGSSAPRRPVMKITLRSRSRNASFRRHRARLTPSRLGIPMSVTTTEISGSPRILASATSPSDAVSQAKPLPFRYAASSARVARSSSTRRIRAGGAAPPEDSPPSGSGSRAATGSGNRFGVRRCPDSNAAGKCMFSLIMPTAPTLALSGQYRDVGAQPA